ncbi:MAG: rhomboid family intramembrane serine protease [Solirubrobacterales bacterium]
MLPLKDNLKMVDLPILTIALIVINCLVFFGWEGGGSVDDRTIVLHGAVPYEITHPGTQCAPASAVSFRCDKAAVMESSYGVEFPSTVGTIFTSMFMHINFAHLLGNMIFLFVFGMALELGLGRLAYSLFYVIGGLGAMLGHLLFEPGSMIPVLGASGAISAVMGGYLMTYPRAKIFTWVIPPLPFLWGWIKAAWLIGILMGLQVLQAYFTLASFGGGGVAYFAHFGGFAAGAGLVMLVVDRDYLEELRRRARIASGEEFALEAPADTVPGAPPAYGQPQPAGATQWQPAGYAAPAQMTGVANAPPPVPADPFAPPPQRVVPPDPFAPQPQQRVVPPDPFAPPPQPRVVPSDPFAPPGVPQPPAQQRQHPAA